MNARTLLAASAFLTVLLVLTAGGGVLYGKNLAMREQAEASLQLQQEIDRQAAQLTQQEAVIAEQARLKREADAQTRLAVETRDVLSSKIDRLQRDYRAYQKAQAEKGIDKDIPDDIILLRASFFVRVLNESAGYMPDKGTPGGIQARHSTIAQAGDSPNFGGGYWCDSEKCCKQLRILPKSVQRVVASVR